MQDVTLPAATCLAGMCEGEEGGIIEFGRRVTLLRNEKAKHFIIMESLARRTEESRERPGYSGVN